MPHDPYLLSAMVTVLFVCVHNAARSQMAEGFFNDLAEERHRAISAGSYPGDRVNPVAVQAMEEEGIDIRGASPKKLTSAMVEEANIVITMGCGENVCPVVPKEIMDWALEDPSGLPIEEVRAIRDEIRRRVLLLLGSLDDPRPLKNG